MKPILIFWKYDIIPRATNSVEALNIDKLIFEYLPYPEPHRQMDKFLAENTEYTHIIVVTNDVVVMPSNLQKLLDKVEENPDEILSAVMNVDRNENIDKLNICDSLPDGEYNWVNTSENRTGIWRVEFAGFPLMCIPIEIAKQFKWSGFRRGATDLRFCQYCKESEIPIYADFNNQMLHLRFEGEKPKNKQKKVILEKLL